MYQFKPCYNYCFCCDSIRYERCNSPRYLRYCNAFNIPNLVYLAPTCKEEYLAMVEWSMSQRKYPVAIRVPGNGVISNPNCKPIDFDNLNKYSVTKEGGKVAILGLGTFYQLGESVADEIKKQYGIDATVVNPVYITGTDKDLLAELAKTHDVVITLEDGILNGGSAKK